MRKIVVILLFFCISPWFSRCTFAVTTEAILIGKGALPVVAGSVRDVAGIARTAKNLLYIPKGIVKAGISILPGVSMKGGFRDIGAGISAATRMTGQTLRLPFNFLKRSTRQVKRLSPVKFRTR